MSSFPEESFQDHIRVLIRMVMDKVITAGTQIANWLVVGNAAALVLTFNGALQGATCDRGLIRDAALSFAIGLGLAFAGSVVGYVGNLLNVSFLTKVQSFAETMYISQFYMRDAEEKKEQPAPHHQLRYDEAGTALTSLKHRTLWLVPGIALALYLGAMACFARGLLIPIARVDLALSTCSAKSHPASLPLAQPPRGQVVENAAGTPAVK